MTLTYWDWHAPNSLNPPLKAVDAGGTGSPLLEQPILWGPHGLTSVSDYTPGGRNQLGSRNCTAGAALDSYEDRSYHLSAAPSTISTGDGLASKIIAVFGTPHTKKAVSVFFRLSLADVSGEIFILAMNGSDGGNTNPYGNNPTMSFWCVNGFLAVQYGGSSYGLSAHVTDTLFPIAANTTYRIEVGVVRDASAGEIRVYATEEGNNDSATQVFALTGLITKVGSDTGISRVWWGHFRYSGGAVTAGGGADVSSIVIRNGADVLSDADFFFEQNVTPHISANRVVSQGHYNDLAADVSLLDENTFTEAGDYISYGGGGIPKQSWLSTASLPIAGAGGSVVGFVGRVVFSDGDTNNADFVRDYCQVFLRIGGTDYDSPEATNATYINNATILGAPSVVPYFFASSRQWLTNPATAAAWTPTGLDGLEWGCRLCSAWSGVTPTWTGEQNAEAQIVAFAFGEVLWTTLAATTAPTVPDDLTAECEPCTDASAARFLDSHLTYDGHPDDDSEVVLFMSPGADWTTPGLTHTLTSRDSPFLAGDAGNAILLGDLEGDYVVLNVTAYVSADELTVTNATAVPTSLQDILTTEWARMVDEISGLDHLEGETVYSNQDGMPGGPYTVTGGAITLIDVGGAGGAFSAVATIGLRITADLETLDFDVPAGSKSAIGGAKQINQVTIQADKSRSFTMGDPDNAEEGFKPYTLLNIDGNDDLDWALVTRKGNFVLPARADNAGRVFIRHTDPLPLTIITITPKVDLTGKVGS